MSKPRDASGKPEGSPSRKRAKSGVPKAHRHLVQSISEQQYLETAYDDNIEYIDENGKVQTIPVLKDYLPKEKEYNRSVVPSPASKLVSTIFDRVHF